MSDDPYPVSTPDYICVLIHDIGRHVENYLRGITPEDQPDPGNPASNSGAVFECPVFTMRAYYWGCECEGDDNPSCRCHLPNFECGDVRVQWYKHAHRGTVQNREVSPAEFVAIYDRCMAHVSELERVWWEDLAKGTA